MGVSQLGADKYDRRIRSGLISSQMMGLAMMRYIWKIEPLATMSEDDILNAAGPNLQNYIAATATPRRSAEPATGPQTVLTISGAPPTTNAPA